MFEEEDDDGNESGVDTGNLEKGGCVEIEMEDGIGIDELEIEFENMDGSVKEQSGISGNQENSGSDQHPVENIDENTQQITTEVYVSDYTGEMSTVTSVPAPVETVGKTRQRNDSSGAVDNEITQVTPEDQIDDSTTMDGRMSPYPHTSSSDVNSPFRRPSTTGKNSARDKPTQNVTIQPALTTDSEDSVDMDSYISPHPGTSASQAMMPPSGGHKNRNGGSTVSRPSAQESLPKTSKSNGIQSSQQKSRIDLVTPRTHNINRSVPQRVNGTFHRSDTTTSAATSTSTSTYSKEQRIEAIRQRMESCLSAITNKVTEKSERSPHAPFLAYLGTKLSLVPPELLPNLEREILEMVNHHSM